MFDESKARVGVLQVVRFYYFIVLPSPGESLGQSTDYNFLPSEIGEVQLLKPIVLIVDGNRKFNSSMFEINPKIINVNDNLL